MGKYADSPEWADITPLPTSDGPTRHPLAAIAYSPEYEETMSYLRAVMAANEHSPRVLALTEDLIDMNPAHYTVWLYRAKTLLTLDGTAALQGELEWLNGTALAHQKNYQIWHHRNMVVDRLGTVYEGENEEKKAKLVHGEREFMKLMFERDAKNYHVWSYRQWLVRRFGLWASAEGTKGEGELGFVEALIEEDVRNNSAWNHRWYVVNGEDGRGVQDSQVREREVDFAKSAIRKTPSNTSPWNYLRGIVRKAGAVEGLQEFGREFANIDEPDTIQSSQALDFLVDLLAQDEEEKQQVGKALDLLTTKFDPIRKNYWDYRKRHLGLPVEAA